MNKLYELKLHETMQVTANQSAMRVPGGWIYYTKNSSCFVPFTTELNLIQSYEDQFNDIKRKLERNLGEDWTNANKKDIIDVICGVYIPF